MSPSPLRRPGLRATPGPSRAYVVCSTPRSGSTLLCQLLAGTGVAGRPEEYFEAVAATGLPPHPGDYLEGLPRTGAGIRDDPTPATAPEYSDLRSIGGYREHVERTLRLGTTANGVFATKLMWRQLDELRTLAGALPEYAGLDIADLLDGLFGGADGVHYVWMRRRDKVRQAISLWRALQTRTWRREHAGAHAHDSDLHYSFEGISHLEQSLATDDESWGLLFDALAIEALEITYEDDLERDQTATIARVLELIGIALPTGWTAAAPISRQADALTEEWVAAYHRDAAARVESPIA